MRQKEKHGKERQKEGYKEGKEEIGTAGFPHGGLADDEDLHYVLPIGVVVVVRVVRLLSKRKRKVIKYGHEISFPFLAPIFL